MRRSRWRSSLSSRSILRCSVVGCSWRRTAASAYSSARRTPGSCAPSCRMRYNHCTTTCMMSISSGLRERYSLTYYMQCPTEKTSSILSGSSSFIVSNQTQTVSHTVIVRCEGGSGSCTKHLALDGTELVVGRGSQQYHDRSLLERQLSNDLHQDRSINRRSHTFTMDIATYRALGEGIAGGVGPTTVERLHVLGVRIEVVEEELGAMVSDERRRVLDLRAVAVDRYIEGHAIHRCDIRWTGGESPIDFCLPAGRICR